MKSFNKRNQISAYKFLIPFFIVFILINLVPYLIGLYMSFNYWYLMTEFKSENIKFVGIENFTLLYTEPGIKQAMSSVLLYVSLSVMVIHPLALFFAKMISYCLKSTQAWIILAFITPYVVSDMAIEFSLDIFRDASGNLKYFKENWVSLSYYDALISIYQLVGFFTIVYYMVLKSVPKNIIEAAQLDGASIFLIFYKIEFNYMKKMIIMMFVLSIVMLIGSARGINFVIDNLWFVGDMGISAAFTWTYIYYLMLIIFFIFLYKKVRSFMARPFSARLSNQELSNARSLNPRLSNSRLSNVREEK